MERQFDSRKNNYYSSDQSCQQRTYGNRGASMKESFNKRKLMEESDDYQNKRSCTSMSWTASTSTSIHGNENASSSGRNLKYKQETLSNQLDRFKHSCPHRFLSLMYQLELSALCLLRNRTLTNSTQLPIFKTSKNGQFNNIILRFKGEYFCIKVLHIDTHYVTKCLNFNSLFTTESIDLANHLNEFAIELLYYLDSVADAPKYLILYTNCALDISSNQKLNEFATAECKRVQFSRVTAETDQDLIELLTSSGEKKGEFYRFASDERNRNRLHYLLKFSAKVKSKLGLKRLKAEKIKQKFLDRLIFAVNQPTIEELVDTVRTEVQKVNEHFVEIRKEVLNQLTSDETITENLPSAVYSFNLFLFCIHDMLRYENISAVKFDEKINGHNVAINSRNKVLYFRPLEVDVDKLSPNEFKKQSERFSVNSLFKFFSQLARDVEYFVIFTNANLTLVGELILGGEFEKTSCLKFSRLNAKENFLFRHSFLDANNLYQFSPGETRNVVMNLLNNSQTSESVTKRSPIKELFVDKIVFAVQQYDSDEMYKVLERELDGGCKELHKIALRYLESHEMGSLNKDLMITLGDNLRNEDQNIQSRLFEEEIEFAKRVIPLQAPEFSEFVDFLTKRVGKVCLDNLRSKGIKIAAISSIIEGSDKEHVERNFLQLYNLLFDQEGNKTNFLKVFEGHGLCVDNICHMLTGSGSASAKTLVDLHALWFDDFGNPTNCLRILQTEGINLSHVSLLLSKTRANSVNKFKELYSLWFNENGTKKHCLRNLEENGVSLTIMCGVLQEAGQLFRKLYKLWFDERGHKTGKLTNLERIGINLNHVCSVIKGSGTEAMEAFKRLYALWFDREGRKTIHLEQLENEGLSLALVFDIFPETGVHFAKMFKSLDTHWFDKNGEKTECLKILEANGRTLSVICKLLTGQGSSAVEKFKQLARSLGALDC